jgi:hypothetical protein
MTKSSDQKNRRKKAQMSQAVGIRKRAARKKRRSPELDDYVFDLRGWNKELAGR